MYPPPLSEKARGKLHARSPSLDGSDITRVPADLWQQKNGLNHGRRGFLMESILLAVTELLPLIQSSSPLSVALLASTILVGILPPPPAIISRWFQWTECSKVWRKAIANVTSAVGNMWSAVGRGRTGQPGIGSPRSSRDGGEGGTGWRQ
ncbi:hypothetical protein BU17DRAFT_68802 [Hysterangium stoloniferum]|nr:hypothetical protein BU17DRAFT_68802 [Hysterangium stoloniferum]